MNRRTFLKSATVSAAGATAVAVATSSDKVSEVALENKWIAFEDQMPEPGVKLQVRHEKVGDIRAGELENYRGDQLCGKGMKFINYELLCTCAIVDEEYMAKWSWRYV